MEPEQQSSAPRDDGSLAPADPSFEERLQERQAQPQRPPDSEGSRPPRRLQSRRLRSFPRILNRRGVRSHRAKK